MILTASHMKDKDLTEHVYFRIKNNRPTHAQITYVKMEEIENGNDLEEVEYVVSRPLVEMFYDPNTNIGVYHAEFYLPGIRYVIVPDGETKETRIETTFTEELNSEDGPLLYTLSGSNINLFVPHCDITAVNVEIYNLDGDLLRVLNVGSDARNAPKFWEEYPNQWLDYTYKGEPRRQKLFHRLSVNRGTFIKDGEESWKTLEDLGTFQVRVDNVHRIINNNLIYGLCLSHKLYSYSSFRAKVDLT